MANEMFTNRFGKQVPVPTFVIPASEVVSLLRLQEDYIKRGEHLSLLGVVLDVLDKGTRTVRYHWQASEVSKNRRDFSKNVTVYMADPAKYANEIRDLAIKHGLVKGTQVDMSGNGADNGAADSASEPTEEQLEAITSPETK